MTPIVSDAERTWRIVQITGALGTIGLALDAVLGSPAGPARAQVAAVVVCAAIWIYALLRRTTPSLATGNTTLLVINGVILVALCASAQRIAESGIDWVPFRPNHLGAVAVALLAPPVAWVGVVTITAFVATAVIQWTLFDPAIRANLPYGDPWATVGFGGFAMVLLFYRRRADRIEREVARTQSEAESYQRYARAMLAIRDLSNSPLQTLTNLLELIREHGVELQDTVERLERTLARLVELEQATRPFEHDLEWQPGDESWDPKSILDKTARRA